jgi:hypothetical protein
VTGHAVRRAIAALAAGLAACAVCSCSASATSVGHGPASPAASASASRADSAGAVATVSAASFATPLQATLSWFAAVNAKDRAAAVAHFVPADEDMMDWGNGDTSTWPAFTRLRC